MKLVTYESDQQWRVGVVEDDCVVDVNAVLGFFARGTFANPAIGTSIRTLRDQDPLVHHMIDLLSRGERYLRALRVIARDLAEKISNKEDFGGLFTSLTSARLGAPIARPGKITCLGLNYADHAREQGHEPPASPIYFVKTANTICGPGDPIVLPPNSAQVDYEAEFAVVIGKGGRRIPEERALEHVAGYMIMNDVSARDMQFGDKQWYRGKSCDTFAPCGPWIVTKDEVPDPHNLRISLTLNGETMQDSNTSNLIFKVPYLISYLSQSVTWEPGDIISTGTPPGVGVFREPPIFLKPGDTVSIAIERLGTLTNAVAAS